MDAFDSKIKDVQLLLQKEKLNGWLLYDFRRSNSLAHHFLNIPTTKKATRRFFYWIPEHGEPIKIVSQVESNILDHLPGLKRIFRGWEDLEYIFQKLFSEKMKIAMEYSPFNRLPTVSKVDAGMLELVHKTGAQVVSSANLIQFQTSVWTLSQYESHRHAAQVLEIVASRTWDYITRTLQNGFPLNEYLVQQFMAEEISSLNCFTLDPPTCAVNVNSADPHYSPTEGSAQSIKKGDIILIDLWCKQNSESSVYADITRMGVASKKGSPKQESVFQIVKSARDKASQFVKERYEKRIPIQGWEVDNVCREVIQEAGYGEYFVHRTGHNLGEEVHGPGANLDNLETHDYRQLLTGSGFTIEPGIYLPQEFGIRLEYDIYLNPSGIMEITGGIQNEFVYLNL